MGIITLSIKELLAKIPKVSFAIGAVWGLISLSSSMLGYVMVVFVMLAWETTEEMGMMDENEGNEKN